jgi:antitoxin component of RelBE/YafQ-DinJ toxin-antitoxin module
LSLVYVGAEKALPFEIKVPNAEIRATVAQL